MKPLRFLANFVKHESLVFDIATSSCRCIADLVGKDDEVDRQARALGPPHQAIAALQAHVESIENAI